MPSVNWRRSWKRKKYGCKANRKWLDKEPDLACLYGLLPGYENGRLINWGPRPPYRVPTTWDWASVGIDDGTPFACQ
jgi:hypothetical protein